MRFRTDVEAVVLGEGGFGKVVAHPEFPTIAIKFMKRSSEKSTSAKMNECREWEKEYEIHKRLL